MKKCILVFSVLALLNSSVQSQNMNLPYSVYGVGDIDFRAYNRTSGMASTGISLTSPFHVIDNNPAALTGLVRSFYVVNIAATGRVASYSGIPIDETNRTNQDFWIKRFSLAVKINKFWASSVGVKPFSIVNYLYSDRKMVEGLNTMYPTIYQGDGGLNEYYWTNAFSIGKKFSIGLQASIISGGINLTETVSDETLQSVITARQQDYFGRTRLQGGFLYSSRLNKNWEFALGGKYSPATTLPAERTVTVEQNGIEVKEEESFIPDRMQLPDTYGMGISFRHKQKTVFALDYIYENWGGLNIRGNGWNLVNSNRASAGVEFIKHDYILNQQVEKRFFQLGAFLNNSYLQVNNVPIREFGFTAGMGGSLNHMLGYNLSAEMGVRGTVQSNLIRENFFQITIGISYRDFLFSQGRKFN